MKNQAQLSYNEKVIYVSKNTNLKKCNYEKIIKEDKEKLTELTTLELKKLKNNTILH